MKKYIQCKICNKEMKQITAQHLKFHNITISEYKKKFREHFVGRSAP